MLRKNSFEIFEGFRRYILFINTPRIIKYSFEMLILINFKWKKILYLVIWFLHCVFQKKVLGEHDSTNMCFHEVSFKNCNSQLEEF